jgi:hypothetical protein
MRLHFDATRVSPNRQALSKFKDNERTAVDLLATVSQLYRRAQSYHGQLWTMKAYAELMIALNDKAKECVSSVKRYGSNNSLGTIDFFEILIILTGVTVRFGLGAWDAKTVRKLADLTGDLANLGKQLEDVIAIRTMEQKDEALRAEFTKSESILDFPPNHSAPCRRTLLSVLGCSSRGRYCCNM